MLEPESQGLTKKGKEQQSYYCALIYGTAVQAAVIVISHRFLLLGI
jgi:hypothetical protein